MLLTKLLKKSLAALVSVDQFGSQINLTIKNKETYKTLVGALASILALVLVLASFIILLKDLINSQTKHCSKSNSWALFISIDLKFIKGIQFIIWWLFIWYYGYGSLDITCNIIEKCHDLSNSSAPLLPNYQNKIITQNHIETTISKSDRS